MITQDELKHQLHFNCETGIFTRIRLAVSEVMHVLFCTLLAYLAAYRLTVPIAFIPFRYCMDSIKPHMVWYVNHLWFKKD